MAQALRELAPEAADGRRSEAAQLREMLDDVEHALKGLGAKRNKRERGGRAKRGSRVFHFALQGKGAEYGVQVYGFCLMTNHVILVLQPRARVAGLGQLMKRLAGRQTRYVNRHQGRSGTLWESRYKSSPIHEKTRKYS